MAARRVRLLAADRRGGVRGRGGRRGRRAAAARAVAVPATGGGRGRGGAAARAVAAPVAAASAVPAPAASAVATRVGAAAARALARGSVGVDRRGRAEAALGSGRDVEIGVEVRRGRVRLGGLRLAELEGAVDERPLVQVVPVDERDRDAGLARAARAADAVQVRLVVLGDGVVDHVGDVEHVDAARRHVGGDEDVLLAGLERGHRALALLLVQVAVHGGGVEAAVVELLDEAGGGALGAREDDGLAAALGLEDAADDLVLVHVVRAVDEVADVRLHEALVGVRRADVDRLRHEAAGERHDRARHGGREQHGVAHGRGLREELLDVGEEPEVEHLVGLVEHHLAHVLEREQALAHEVEETARRADDDLRAGLELLDLPLVRLAAVDGDDRGGAVLGGDLEVLGDLDGELARRHDHERLHAGLRGEAEPLDEREAEAEGLAGARLGLADDVLAGERQGDGLLLDGEGFEDPVVGQRLHHVLVDVQFGESHVVPCLAVRSTPGLLLCGRDGALPLRDHGRV